MVTRIGGTKGRKLYIAEWREKRGLTQQQLADRVPTTKGSISRWENAERDPTKQVIDMLADALGIEPGDLWHHPDRPSPADLLRDATPDEISRALTVIRALKSA